MTSGRITLNDDAVWSLKKSAVKKKIRELGQQTARYECNSRAFVRWFNFDKEAPALAWSNLLRRGEREMSGVFQHLPTTAVAVRPVVCLSASLGWVWEDPFARITLTLLRSRARLGSERLAGGKQRRRQIPPERSWELLCWDPGNHSSPCLDSLVATQCTFQ